VGGAAGVSNMIWANLIHLGMNMWADRPTDAWPAHIRGHVVASDKLRFSEPLWNQILKRMAANGMNMVILDLGEGVKYRSHPEIACKGAWPVSKLKKEIKKCADMGIEVIPKLNFSTAHDVWLGKYARMVSTDIYYGVCKDLIAEVIDIFDMPRFFHLGMDEETAGHQKHYLYAVMRQHDLWWHDLYFLQEQVEKANVRAWVWSDYIWNHRDAFLKKMPKAILQSNWYYANFRVQRHRVDAYADLDKHGYDQVPTGSNWSLDDNFIKTVRYAKKNLTPKRLVGFMQTPWMPTLPFAKPRHVGAIDQVGEAKRVFEK
jgi:hypothetical protein